MSDLPRLQVGEARAFCISCGPIGLDSLTVQYLPKARIQHHLCCGNHVMLYVGPETRIAIHSHTCGHAIAVPYKEGQEIPQSPGCASLHKKGEGVI